MCRSAQPGGFVFLLALGGWAAHIAANPPNSSMNVMNHPDLHRPSDAGQSMCRGGCCRPKTHPDANQNGSLVALHGFYLVKTVA